MAYHSYVLLFLLIEVYSESLLYHAEHDAYHLTRQMEYADEMREPSPMTLLTYVTKVGRASFQLVMAYNDEFVSEDALVLPLLPHARML